MPGMFSQRKANKSRLKIANQIQDIASIIADDELKNRLLFIRDKSLRQNALPKNWEAIDNELYKLLYELANHASKQNINTVSVYLGFIDKLIDAKSSRDQYILNQQEITLFGLKVQLNEKIDVTGRLRQEYFSIKAKINNLSSDDPLHSVYDGHKKICESNYRDATVKMKYLIELITEISTRLTPEDVGFYKTLRELQGVPEELEDRTAEYLFYINKLSSNVKTSQAINDSRHEYDEPMPSLDESTASHHNIKNIDDMQSVEKLTERKLESDV